MSVCKYRAFIFLDQPPPWVSRTLTSAFIYSLSPHFPPKICLNTSFLTYNKDSLKTESESVHPLLSRCHSRGHCEVILRYPSLLSLYGTKGQNVMAGPPPPPTPGRYERSTVPYTALGSWQRHKGGATQNSLPVVAHARCARSFSLTQTYQ